MPGVGKPRPCTIEGCEHVEPLRRGMCATHYSRWRRHGNPWVAAPPSPKWLFIDAIIEGTAPREPNGCILWPFVTHPRFGYPFIYVGNLPEAGGRRVIPVGHIILEHFEGPRPSRKHSMGHALHEVCGHRHCIAPEHLSWQTATVQAQNRTPDGTQYHPPGWGGKRGEDHPDCRFSDDEVRQAIVRVRGGESIGAVARSIGAGRSTVSAWVRGRVRREIVAHLAHPHPTAADHYRKAEG